MTKNKLFLTVTIISIGLRLSAQEFISLWPTGKMPNSKGLVLKDSIFDERYRRVGTPGMYAFFPSKQENKGAAVIICPGGGYKHFAYISSGTQIAKWFNTMGINAFVLITRLPHSPDLIERSEGPLQDAQRAIRIIRANAKTWNIKLDKIGIIGFSAGGHVASSLGTHIEDVSKIGDSLDSIPFRPDFMLLVSPVITMGKFAHTGSRDNLLGPNPSMELIAKYSNELQVTGNTPPAFIVHADNDKTVNPQNSLMFYNALRDKKISASLHIFPQGGHAIGLRNNPGSAGLWTNLCEMWLIEMNIINEIQVTK
jgi:acetyl esterase/lipase